MQMITTIINTSPKIRKVTSMKASVAAAGAYLIILSPFLCVY
jgi:hypothetical protein